MESTISKNPAGDFTILYNKGFYKNAIMLVVTNVNFYAGAFSAKYGDNTSYIMKNIKRSCSGHFAWIYLNSFYDHSLVFCNLVMNTFTMVNEK